MFEVRFYKDSNGYSDVLEMLSKLHEKSKTSKNDKIKFDKINHHIEALCMMGTSIGSPVVKYLDNGLWELRPNSNRLMFFFFKNNEYVILSHFIKKSQKTPKSEIDKAKRRMKDFLERFDRE
jgi:phage-related protein